MAIRQKINMEIEDVGNTINPIHLTDIYGTLHPIKAEYTFFSIANEPLCRIYHTLVHKTNLKKLKNDRSHTKYFSQP